jgi:hypothetical protein
VSSYLARPERALIDAAVDRIYDLLGAAGYHFPHTGLFDPIAETLAALLDNAAEQVPA